MKKIKELDPTIVGKNIAKLREAKHISQEQLGIDAGGIAASSICKYEKGTQLPRLDTLYYISVALGCTLDQLITGESGSVALKEGGREMDQEEMVIRHLAALLDAHILGATADQNGRPNGYFYLDDNTSTLFNFVNKYQTILNLKNETGDQFEAVKESTITFYVSEYKNALERKKMVPTKMGVFGPR